MILVSHCVRGQGYIMKTLLMILFTCLTYQVCSQNLPTNGDMSNPRSDKNQQFRSACPQQCGCSETACGLQVDCSFRMLTEVPTELSPLTECLDLSMNNISEIAVDAFKGLRQLKKLCLSGNHIKDLPQNVFAETRKLERLLMQDNKLEEVPANTVSKLTHLKDLNLGANYISSVSPNAFTRLDSLEHVWLDDNRLTEIPYRALGKAPTIKALALDLNKITVVRDGDLDELPMLRVLLLKHNAVEQIENNAFERSANIQIIDLAYNNLASLPPALKNALTLHQLTISNNRIKFLPDFAFAGNPELRTLTLTGNPIKIAGKTAFTGLKNLQRLSLENAEDMREFPDLTGCTQLNSLLITGGKLNSIPRGLCTDLPNLKELNLRGNRLRNFSGLLRCGKLERLDVSENELTEVVFEYTRNMTKMRDLNLGSNKIRQLDKDAFSKMNHIENLNLARNIFTYLPMKGLGSLQELNVSGVQTMLYLPPIALFHNLKSLAAYYSYHCCQVVKIPRIMDDQSVIQQFPLHIASESIAEEGDFSPMTSPVQCSPEPGPMTPCDDLLPSPSIRVFWWLATVLAFLLNGVILISCGLRHCAKKTSARTTPSDEEILRRTDSESSYSVARIAEYRPHYFLNLSSRSIRSDNDAFDLSLCHLALADFIASAYTAVILNYDHSTLGNFAENGAWWQQSALCHSAGFLLTFGTQLAFSTVAVMALERCLATLHPLQTERHMRKNVLVMSLSFAWVISLATGTVTLFGNTGNDENNDLLNMLQAKSGATCMPWTTEFAYVAVLVGVHIAVCFAVLVACAMMFCARKKNSWLSARERSRGQVFAAAAVNVFFILPLALLALCVSGFMTYSGLIAGHGGEYVAPENGRTVLHVGRLLTFVTFVLPFRPLLNPILYLSFNRPLRNDLTYVAKKAIFGESDARRSAPFSQRRDSVSETSFHSVGDGPQESTYSYPLFNRPYFCNDFTRQTLTYDNSGIVSSSSTSNRAPSILLASRAATSQRSISSERRKRRRYTRSQREERRATDTDLATESEGITFQRGGVVSYNPETKQRRMRMQNVRYGGVNARDEFQHLVFPRVSNALSSGLGSDAAVYPTMPTTSSAAVGSSCVRIDFEMSSKALQCDANTSDMSLSSDCSTAYKERPIAYSEISSSNSCHDRNAANRTECHGQMFGSNDTLSDADAEVAGITAGKSPVSWDENPFFNNRDTAKRLHGDITSQKTCLTKAGESDWQPSSSRETNNNCDRIHVCDVTLSNGKDVANLSASKNALQIGPTGKISNSCEYCDSAASKDSGIHSEIDSTSGASYSDASIGRRLPFSMTSGGGLRTSEIPTLLDETKSLHSCEKKFSFEVESKI